MNTLIRRTARLREAGPQGIGRGNRLLRRINLTPNGGWEQGVVPFIASSGNTNEQSDDQVHSGLWAGKLVYGLTGTGCAVYPLTLPNGKIWIAEEWVYIPTAFDGGGIRLEPGSFTSVTLGSTANRDANMGLRDQWQRLVQAFTPADDRVGDVRLTRTGVAPSASGVIYADDLRVY